jgi:predicted molibdopterin-dependent oxidoreductase YjgC
MTRRTANLQLDAEDRLDLHPSDADRYAVRDGEPIVVESRHGRATLAARLTDEAAPGQVFCSFHFPSSQVNTVTSGHADTETSCPEYKVTAVRLKLLHK